MQRRRTLKAKKITEKEWRKKAGRSKVKVYLSKEWWKLVMDEIRGKRLHGPAEERRSQIRRRILEVNKSFTKGKEIMAKKELERLLGAYDERFMKPMINKFGNRKVRQIADRFYQA